MSDIENKREFLEDFCSHKEECDDCKLNAYPMVCNFKNCDDNEIDDMFNIINER